MCGGGLGTADFARIKVTDRHDPTKVPGARGATGTAARARGLCTHKVTDRHDPTKVRTGRPILSTHAAHRTHGGIGSGKSTVSAMLADLGAHVIDADAIAREVVAPGTEGLAALVEVLGRTSSPLMRHSTGPRWRTKYSPTKQPASASMRSPPRIAARTADLLRNIPDDAVRARRAAAGGGRSAGRLRHGPGVDAPDEVRVQRFAGARPGRAGRLARIAAQATREQRLAVADVVRTTPEAWTTSRSRSSEPGPRSWVTNRAASHGFAASINPSLRQRCISWAHTARPLEG